MTCIDPNFDPLVDRLLMGSFTGTFLQNIAIKESGVSGPTTLREDYFVDHFKVHIPYAGHTLVWEVRFDSHCPEMAPDFLFDDENFTKYLNVDILSDGVPSLTNWNIEDPECLKNVLQELLNVFTVYQLKQLEKNYSTFGDECSRLMQEYELEESQLQVLSGDVPAQHHFQGLSRPPRGTVSVLILNLEKQILIEGIQDQYRQMALQINIREYSPNSVILHINPVLHHILGEQSELEVPNFSKTDTLSYYFQNFVQVIHETLTQVIQNYVKRQEFHLGIYYELSEIEDVSVEPAENDFPIFTLSSYVLDVKSYPVMLIIQTPRHSDGDPKVSVNSSLGGHQNIKGNSWDVSETVEAIIHCIIQMRDEDCDSGEKTVDILS